MTRVSLPLKWHGGKHYLAKQIIGMMPPHLHYVEPYFGGGAVLFAKPLELVEGHSEVVNDIDGELTNFWRVLKARGTFAHFQRLCNATPFSQELFNDARRMKQSRPAGDGSWGGPVHDALEFFIRYRQSRQGLGKDFATLSRNRTRRGMNEQASSWLSAVEGLPEAHERLKRVVILNDDGCKVIRQQDGEKTLFYCDPPYLHETRTATECYGEHEMTPKQHDELLHTLAAIRGKFLLSGYPSKLYRTAEKRFCWNCREIEIDNKASGKKAKPTMTECVWSNF